MKIAEMVTFGGGGLDRAADRRGASAEMLARDEARCVVIWRGKPLLSGDALLRVTPGDAVLAEALPVRVFLGMVAGAPLFAADISAWEPDEATGPLDGFADRSEQRHPARPDAAFTELRMAMTRLSPLEAEIAATAKAVLGWHVSHRFCARCGTESTAAQGGWQRSCAACGGHNFPRTDPVVIMLIVHGNDVLLGRSPGWPEGMYSLLAGFVEPGETLEAAVRREVWEETRVTVGQVEYLASQPWPFPSSLMLGCIGHATSREITIDPVEIEDALWVGREELLSVFAGQHDRILPARQGAIAHFLLENWLADRLD